MRDEKPDMIITYSIKPNIYAGYAARRLGIPYCANIQGLGTAFQKKLISAIVTLMYKVALKKARIVLFENRANADKFISRRIVSESIVTIMSGTGVNPQYYTYKEFKKDSEQIHFLYVGRIMHEKGIDELLDAYARLKKEYGERVMLEMVGFYEEEYEKSIEKLRSESALIFHGFDSDPRPYYEMADCIVLPSYHEGMSNVLLEAAASGRPIITSDVPSCREAVDEGVSGFLCAPRDSKSLYSAMERFMHLTVDDRIHRGKNGRAKMIKEFARDAVVAATLKAYGIV